MADAARATDSCAGAEASVPTAEAAIGDRRMGEGTMAPKDEGIAVWSSVKTKTRQSKIRGKLCSYGYMMGVCSSPGVPDGW